MTFRGPTDAQATALVYEEEMKSRAKAYHSCPAHLAEWKAMEARLHNSAKRMRDAALYWLKENGHG